jgi:hypothetical protein
VDRVQQKSKKRQCTLVDFIFNAIDEIILHFNVLYSVKSQSRVVGVVTRLYARTSAV